ncbi:hypothetical protein CO613_10675 [Lysobacteraceae bacterium NML07-0707]|nr:hypothetical protein CO613_10675 [Xanthomonadaceae bacterium NML07-0707]
MAKQAYPPLPVCSPGRILQSYSPEETAFWLKQWQAVFGRNAAGIDTGSYLWHVFSAGGYPALAGEAARSAYRQQEVAETIVLANDRCHACRVEGRPDTVEWPDCYVFPANLAWCMAFTHEDGWYGSYFARHPRPEPLDAENLRHYRQAQRKQAQQAYAQRQGWR